MPPPSITQHVFGSALFISSYHFIYSFPYYSCIFIMVWLRVYLCMFDSIKTNKWLIDWYVFLIPHRWWYHHGILYLSHTHSGCYFYLCFSISLSKYITQTNSLPLVSICPRTVFIFRYKMFECSNNILWSFGYLAIPLVVVRCSNATIPYILTVFGHSVAY